MYKDYYKLSAEPFSLTPDPRFIYVHGSFRRAHANMQQTLDQGDGFLVVTGRPGTGKTTLSEGFLATIRSKNFSTATIVSSNLGKDDVLRMVAYAFGLEADNLDKAHLLRMLEEFFLSQTRSLLIIDEAQNLSVSALEEVRMLTNLHTHSRQLLQVFLLGQEQFNDRLQTAEMEQLHQRVMAVCILEPLSLQETHDYVLHRLACANWNGTPAINAEVFVLIHRFSQGLPRYISKLCARLLLHGAMNQRDRLDVDDAVSVFRQMQREQLFPIAHSQHPAGNASSPTVQDLIRSDGIPADQRLGLTPDEQAFIAEISKAIATASATKPTVSAVPIADIAESKQQVAPVRSKVQDSPRQWLRSVRSLPNPGVVTAVGLAVMAMLVYVLLPGAGVPGDQMDKISREAVTTPAQPQTIATPPRTEPIAHAEPTVVKDGPLSTDDYQELFFPLSAPTVLGRSVDQVQNTTLVPPVSTVSAADAVTPEAAALPQDATLPQEPASSTETLQVVETGIIREQNPEALSGEVVPNVRDAEIEKLLLLGEQAVADDRLRIPDNNNAWRYFQQVLEIDPGNPIATKGLHQVITRYGELALSAMEKQEYDMAQRFINRGLGVVADEQELLALQTRIVQGRAEVLAAQEREQLAASKAASAAEQAAQPKGFFGTLKRIFSRPKKTETNE